MGYLPVRHVGTRVIDDFEWDMFVVDGFDPNGAMPQLHVPDIGDWPAGGLKPAPVGEGSVDVKCEWPSVFVRGPRADIAKRSDRIGIIAEQ